MINTYNRRIYQKNSLKNKKVCHRINCKIMSFCHVTNMGVNTTEMNSNMWSVLTNSKSADFIISMLHQMFTTGHTKYGQYSN